MLKIGILGMGMMGSFHAARYLELPNARLVAIADRDPERLEAEAAVQGNLEDAAVAGDLSEVARYREAEDLIAEADVDVVDVCLPTYRHPRYTIAALEAGHHVLCEKPMALTVAEADRMLDAARRADRYLMIAQCLRFWPEYESLRRYIEQAPCGRLRSLSMWRIGGRPGWAERNWYLDPARSGGAILDLHIHDVDYVNAVLGAPDTLHAVAGASDRGGYDIVHACYTYDRGPQVALHAGWSAAQIPFTAGFEAWFERGFLRYQGGELTFYDDPSAVAPQSVPFEPGDAYTREIAYFLECVETDTPPIRCPPGSARDSVALIHREIASITSSPSHPDDVT